MKNMAKLAVLAAVTPAFAFIAAPAASAADCAVLADVYVSGGSKYAKVKNTCGRTITAKAVVNWWGDSRCVTIAAYGSESVRTGGIASPNADSAREC